VHHVSDGDALQQLVEDHRPGLGRRHAVDEPREQDEEDAERERTDDAEREREHHADPPGDTGRTRVRSVRASSARRMRPPSIGNAGRRLKLARTRFVMASQPTTNRTADSDGGTASRPA